MSNPSHTKRKGFLRHFRGLVREAHPCADLDLRGSLRLGKSTVRLPPPALPLQILLGGEQGYRLHLYPEPVLDSEGRFEHRGSYLLVDPMTYFSDISGFIRLSEGDTLTLGRDDPTQRLLLRYPRAVEPQHLRLKLSADELSFKNKSRSAGVCIAPLATTDLMERITRSRRLALERLARVLGGPIEPLPRAPSLDLLEQVIALMDQEPYRALNRLGQPGGLLILPDRATPIFVGDLRARIDNLLVILTQNAFLQALEEGSAILIILGSAVHPDRPEQAAEMDSSILMMDLIFRLKLRFPERVFYLRGHHDSFSEAISCAGLPQGSLWEDALHQTRGPAYRDAMRRFYARLPLVAVTSRYLAAHAAPPITAEGWQTLVDIDRNPELADRLVRVPHPSEDDPSGTYGRRELSRMFRRLGLAESAVCVLGGHPAASAGHRTRDTEDPEHLRRVFSADPHWVGTLTRSHKRLLPLRYPAEPLLEVYNRLLRTAGAGNPSNRPLTSLAQPTPTQPRDAPDEVPR
ncbi:metallophosphoesterase family protein [Thiocapsa bogorovii]|uniref:metallophosphoesterase n=1 Tax=Thiocapsa bogorovii TaxID=521689 RepID=UPI001E4B0747|nr:metallophosphoesterase [Thiocapsa bogorovii]UHD18067.1 metallophosphoesterase [Thiocapsa bogorovii]